LFMGKASISLLTGAGLLIAKLRLFESDLHCSGCILKRSVGQWSPCLLFFDVVSQLRSTVGDVVELVSDDQIPGFCHFVLASASCRCLKSNQYSVLPSFLPFFFWRTSQMDMGQNMSKSTRISPNIIKHWWSPSPPPTTFGQLSGPAVSRPWRGKCLYRLQTDAASPGDFLGSQTWARGDRSSITLEAGRKSWELLGATIFEWY
jgi:hypothetical protein